MMRKNEVAVRGVTRTPHTTHHRHPHTTVTDSTPHTTHTSLSPSPSRIHRYIIVHRIIQHSVQKETQRILDLLTL